VRSSKKAIKKDILMSKEVQEDYLLVYCHVSNYYYSKISFPYSLVPILSSCCFIAFLSIFKSKQ